MKPFSYRRSVAEGRNWILLYKGRIISLFDGKEGNLIREIVELGNKGYEKEKSVESV